MAQCSTQIIWSFENQSLVRFFHVYLFLSRVNKLCWQFAVGMYLAQTMYITNFMGQPLSMKNTICNTVLYNALGFCICKYKCKSIPSLEGLKSPFHERHGRKPTWGQARRVKCPHMVRGWENLLQPSPPKPVLQKGPVRALLCTGSSQNLHMCMVIAMRFPLCTPPCKCHVPE